MPRSGGQIASDAAEAVIAKTVRLVIALGTIEEQRQSLSGSIDGD